LVAVGADYNLLLISRIRDESPHGVRVGVIRTVGSTGGVITAAGLIFAASMFGLLFASISMMVQAGFVLGMGILLDTFLVRTVTVPAIAALVGRANWWPSRPQQHKSDGVGTHSHLAKIRKAVTPKFLARRRLATQPATGAPESASDDTMPPDRVEPSPSNGERPLETDDQRPAEREPVLAVTPAWRAGRMLDR
jgi:RND superfamily putative drug exporter